MPNRMYVGNLPYTFTAADLEQLFSEFGKVVSAQVINDRETGRSRGFGFVEMDSPDSFRSALGSANGKDVQGRQISVTEARERTPREGGGGGGDRRPPRPTSHVGSDRGPPRPAWGRDQGGGGGGGGSGGGARGRGERGFEKGRRDDGGKRRGRDEEFDGGRPRKQRFQDHGDDDF